MSNKVSSIITRCFYQFGIALFFIMGFNTAHAQVNAYAKVTGIAGNVLSLSNVNESFHTFTAGEEVIIMQMQDNVIGANTTDAATFGNIAGIASAGLYEVRTILSRTPTSLTLSTALSNTYNFTANSSVQVISNRVLGNPDFTTTGNINALDWDGNVGGVIAIKVPGIFTIRHNIRANGNGFRGGAVTTSGTVDCNPVWRTNDATLSANKGEGIFKRSLAAQQYGKAKIANGGGGGNRHNAGGGGGGNVTTGGTGGPGYSCAATPGGGQGGLSLSSFSAVNRIFMGGGGGGGQQNDAQGTAGGDGGGIILISALQITTSSQWYKC